MGQKKKYYCRECGVILKNGKNQVSLAIPSLVDIERQGEGKGLRGKNLSRKMAISKQKEFLTLMSDSGSVGSVLTKMKLNYSTYKKWCEDPVFSVALEASKELFNGKLHDETVRRAVEGIVEPVVSAGKLVTYVRKYSDPLLISLNKAHDPKLFNSDRKGQSLELSRDEDGTVKMKVYSGFNPDDV